MAHRRICAAFTYSRGGHVWTVSFQPDLSASANANCVSHADSDPHCHPDAVTNTHRYTHRDIDAGGDSDFHAYPDCDIDINAESDTLRNTDSDGHCFGHPDKHSLSFSHCDEVSHGN